MNIRRIAIMSAPVLDEERAASFYADTLGFGILHDSPMGHDRRWLQMAPPGAETSITLVTWFDAMPAGCLRGLVLDTEEIEATRDEHKLRGLEITEIKDAPWGRSATFSDPDGNGWVLQQSRSE